MRRPRVGKMWSRAGRSASPRRELNTRSEKSAEPARMPARVTVRLTANFERDLEKIRAFLGEHDADSTFARLVEDLFDHVIPNLETFPSLGIDFLNRVPASLQGQIKLADLTSRLGEDANLRE